MSHPFAGPGPGPSGGGVSGGGGGGAAAPTPGAIFGVVLANDGTSPNSVLDIAAGSATDSTNATQIALAAAFTKTTGAFVAGSGNGGLDTGAIAASSWYHVFLISKAAGASPDVLLSLSATAPTMPSTYTLKRRIGSIKTNASSQIIAFTQFGDEFRWMAQVTDLNTTSPATQVAVLKALTVPPGIRVLANIIYFCNPSIAGNAILITSPDDTDVAAGVNGNGPYTGIAVANPQGYTAFLQVRTDASAQIRYRANLSGWANFAIYTIGWRDFRGQFG